MAGGEVEIGDRWSAPDVEEFYVEPADAGVEAEFAHARPMHIKMAQAVIYPSGGASAFRAMNLRKEKESGLDELLSVSMIGRSSHTCILLARTGPDTESGGRTFLVLQYPELVKEIQNLVGQGFEITSARGDRLPDDLPDEILPDAEEQ